MTVSLNTMKHTLSESNLKELFDSKPFKTSFNISPGDGPEYETEAFKDKKNNIIQISFLSAGSGMFDLDFTVNNNSYRAENTTYTLTEYSELLATVAAAVSQFLEEYEPYALVFKGADDFKSVQSNRKKEGQKDRIYKYFITQLKSNTNYLVGKLPDGVVLSRKTRRTLEELLK